MQLLLSMPGGSEWILLFIFLSGFVIVPAIAIYYYSKSRRLEKELDHVRREKDILMAKMPERTA